MSDKITPFPGSNNSDDPDLSSMSEQLNSIFSSLPQNGLMHGANGLILQKAARTIVYLQITGRVSEAIRDVGFDPDDFKPDKDTFEDFLIMDPEDYPEDEMHDPDNVFNGPVYDWKDGDRVYRIATTVGFDEDEGMSAVYISLLKLERGADRWEIYGEGVWQPGPDLDQFCDDPFEEDEDEDDEEEDWDEEEEDEDEEAHSITISADDQDSLFYIGLPASIIETLSDSGVDTVADLIDMTKDQIRQLWGIDDKKLAVIMEKMRAAGIRIE